MMHQYNRKLKKKYVKKKSKNEKKNMSKFSSFKTIYRVEQMDR